MTTSDLRAFAGRLSREMDAFAHMHEQKPVTRADLLKVLAMAAHIASEQAASPSEAAPDAPPVMHTDNGPHPRTAREKAMYERGRAEGRAELDSAVAEEHKTCVNFIAAQGEKVFSKHTVDWKWACAELAERLSKRTNQDASERAREDGE